ncbi:MAG: bifunctional heptose 7-phosphate kinase/heptose 1-phosphate adenyltransferase [Armatimonadota bacterium]
MLTPAHNLLTRERLDALLDAVRTVRVGIFGDAALDVYWDADMTLSRLARENPHFILPVVSERMSPGGGGNTSANAAALGVVRTALLTSVGDDWRGRELLHILPRFGVDTAFVQPLPDRTTLTYCKPMRRGLSDVVYEDPHLYFEPRAPLSAQAESLLQERLAQLLTEVDVLIVADYLEFGIVTDRLREMVNAAAADGLPVVVDSRNHINQYRHAILKPNEVEAVWAVSPQTSPHDATLPKLEEIARQLAERNRSRVCLTLGSRGCLWVEDGTTTMIPAQSAPPPVDIVGAGDCFAATFAATLAAGASGPEAAAIANLAAGVVVRKLGTTGTATPGEIRQRFMEDYPS